MARVLIVGCGCRGRALATALVAEGHAVRGTTRGPRQLAAIERVGAEAAIADPDRLGTIMVQLAGVSAICWLMGNATGQSVDSATGHSGGSAARQWTGMTVADLHGPRLRTLLERLVDTPVRGIVYEGAGSVDRHVLAAGAEAVRAAARTWHMPAEVVETDPADHRAWLTAMAAAVTRVL